jgi:hypothetical protein
MRGTKVTGREATTAEKGGIEHNQRLGRNHGGVRMKLLKFVAVLVLALSVDPGAHAAPAAAKTIAVVSVLPPSGHFFHIALIRFGNACKLFDLAGFNLESTIYAAAGSVLSPTYKLVRMSVPPGSQIHTSNTEVMGAFKSFPTVGEQVRQMAQPLPAADFYLVAWGRHTDARCMDYPRPYGIGITTYQFAAAKVHTLVELFLVDAHTLQTLASRSVSADAPLAGFEWKEEAQVVSTQDMGRIRSAMQNLLGSSVATRVREMVSGQ